MLSDSVWYAYLWIGFLSQGDFNRFIYKVVKCWKTEREREGFDCVASWDHGDYTCGHWLPSLSTPKVCRIWINEVGMLSICQTHAGCCLVMPAEYRQQLLDRLQRGKVNLENTGQSLMRHQLRPYRVKWAHWQCITLISLKTTWQGAQYSNMLQATGKPPNQTKPAGRAATQQHFIITLHIVFVAFVSSHIYLHG